MIETILCLVSLFGLFFYILSYGDPKKTTFEWLFISTVLTLVLIGSLSFFLAWGGMYSGTLVSIIIILSIALRFNNTSEIVILFQNSLKEYTQTFSRLNKIEIFVSTMILFTFVGLILPANEDVTMNQDAYVYHTESQIIRENGDLNFDFEILDQISYGSKINFFLNYNEDFGQEIRNDQGDKSFPVNSPGPLYHGFLSENVNNSKISHMYFGFLPSLEAFFSDSFGFSATLNFLPILISILCLVGFFLVMKTTFSKTLSIIATVALVYNVPYIWYSKTISSEMLVLLFLLCISLLIGGFSKLRATTNSALVGILIGVLGLIRFDSVFIWAGLIPALVMMSDRVGKVETKVSMSAFFITLSVCLMYWASTARLYVNGLLSFTSEINTDFSPFLIVVSVCFLIIGIGTLISDRPPIVQAGESTSQYFHYLFFGLIILTPTVIAIGFLSHDGDTPFNYLWNVTKEIVAATSAPFVLFSLLGLGLISCYSLLRPSFINERLSLSLVILVCGISVISAYYNYHLSNQPLYPWAFRRHIIGLIPILSLGTVVFIERLFLFVAKEENPPIIMMTLVFSALLLTPNFISAEEYRGQSNFDGIDEDLEAYSEIFTGNSLILDFAPFSHPSACPYLTFFTHVDCLILWKTPEDSSQWKLLTNEINEITKSRPVYLMNPSHEEVTTIGWYLPLSPMEEIDRRLVTTEVIQWEQEHTDPSFFSAAKNFITYKIETSGIQTAYNDVNWSSPKPGMYFGFAEAIEVHNDREFRWTGQDSLLRFAGPFEPGEYNLTLDINAWRPDEAPNHNLNVYVNGDLVDTIRNVQSRPLNYALSINEVTTDLVVSLESTTFRPSDFTNSADSRDLGIRVYAASFQPVL